LHFTNGGIALLGMFEGETFLPDEPLNDGAAVSMSRMMVSASSPAIAELLSF
jgi:hypothetical protein